MQIDWHHLHIRCISTGKETEQTKLYWVEYFNIMCVYEVPLESSLYCNHGEMDQHTASHLLWLLKMGSERRKEERGWLMEALCAGEMGICVWAAAVSFCHFACAVHLANTPWVLPRGLAVQFAFATLSASSCQADVAGSTRAAKMHFAGRKVELCRSNSLPASYSAWRNLYHKITELLGLEGTSGIIQSNPPAKEKSPREYDMKCDTWYQSKWKQGNLVIWTF